MGLPAQTWMRWLIRLVKDKGGDTNWGSKRRPSGETGCRSGQLENTLPQHHSETDSIYAQTNQWSAPSTLCSHLVPLLMGIISSTFFFRLHWHETPSCAGRNNNCLKFNTWCKLWWTNSALFVSQNADMSLTESDFKVEWVIEYKWVKSHCVNGILMHRLNLIMISLKCSKNERGLMTAAIQTVKLKSSNADSAIYF